MDTEFNRITAQDLRDFRDLVSDDMLRLAECIGDAPWLALVNHYQGVEIPIPKHRAANKAGARRWERIASVVGQDAMHRLSTEYGGEKLNIPVFKPIKLAKMSRWLNFRYTQLREEQMCEVSRAELIALLCVEMNKAGHPKTMRQLNDVLF